jgi:citrate synthase
MKKAETQAFITEHAKTIEISNVIPQALYEQNNVKRGLRNSNGTGVLVGITHVGNVGGYEKLNDVKIPVHGQLYYRGISIFDLVDGFQKDHRLGFEETT